MVDGKGVGSAVVVGWCLCNPEIEPRPEINILNVGPTLHIACCGVVFEANSAVSLASLLTS